VAAVREHDRAPLLLAVMLLDAAAGASDAVAKGLMGSRGTRRAWLRPDLPIG
jgi:hypothetical protein